jgi:hypothetical protein
MILISVLVIFGRCGDDEVADSGSMRRGGEDMLILRFDSVEFGGSENGDDSSEAITARLSFSWTSPSPLLLSSIVMLGRCTPLVT